jgi:hypothetical protein
MASLEFSKVPPGGSKRNVMEGNYLRYIYIYGKGKYRSTDNPEIGIKRGIFY